MESTKLTDKENECSYTMKYYLAIKKKQILTFVTS